MGTYIILSRFGPDAFHDPKDFKKLSDDVSGRIKRDCPGVTWLDSYVTTGGIDAIDIVSANDIAHVERAAMIIRAYGHSTTETLVATKWKEFVDKL